jgi:methionyl-tRNA synthetase
MDKTFYVTTPIYYVNDVPHLGHAYATLVADTLARYHRLAGYDTFFLTGTDEHGEKIWKVVQQLGRDPQDYVDEIAETGFKALWQRWNLSNNDFIRTTEQRHIKYVQSILQRLYDAGDIYFAEYEGLYSVGSERYVTEKELVEGADGVKRLPGDRDPPELRREANYFFKLEKYRPWLIEYLETHPNLIEPIGYRNEVLEMLREPIGDLSISRPVGRLPWGIPIPWDEGDVCYVWFDALLNYVSALGGEGDPRFETYWRKTWHLVGKDILKTHSVFWLPMLKAAGLPLYEKLVVHAHILGFDGRKMGKSLGNAVDPIEMENKYGIDALRYALLRETTFQADSAFGEQVLVNRLNSDLANDLGNLLSRVLSMLEKFHDGIIPVPDVLTSREEAIKAAALKLPETVLEEVRGLRFHLAIERSMEFVRDLNRYVAEQKPWELAKLEDRGRLNTVLYTLVEGIRISSVLLEPVIPEKALEIRRQLGVEQHYSLEPAWGLARSGSRIAPNGVLFPKVELQKTAEPEKPATLEITQPKKETPMSEPAPSAEFIGIEDFAKVQLRVAEVLECERVPKADKLLKLSVALGEERRTILSGIAEYYAPEELIGKSVVVVANLAPRKMRGIESQGMILAATDENGKVVIVSPERLVPSGAEVR